ncbi:radical SAM protein [Nostocoides veronense]|uniref:radical SAM protein n=1 Tax=Nostocoides veronense TaxID=330836 RepID=UPI0031E3CFDD
MKTATSILFDGEEELSFVARERWALWHITRACNIECKYCYGSFSGASYKQLGFHPMELNTAQCVDLAAKLNDHFDGVHINGGEPLLRKDLPFILENWVAIGVRPRVWLLTNGTIRGKSLDRVVESGALDLVAVSIDSFDAQVGNSMRERSQDALRTLKRLIDKRISGSMSAHVGVYTVAHDRNVHGLRELAENLVQLGVDYVNLQPAFSPGSEGPSGSVLNSSAWEVFQDFFSILRSGSVRVSSQGARDTAKWLLSRTGKSTAANCFADQHLYTYISPNGVVFNCPVKAHVSVGQRWESADFSVKDERRHECGHLSVDCLGMYEMASGPMRAR